MQNKQGKMKICFVASVDMTLKFILLSQMKYFSRKGYDVTAVCSDGKWVEGIRKQGIKIKTIEIKRKISPLSDLVSLFNLVRYFRKEKFDIICTHTPKAGLLGQLASKISGVPITANTIFGFYFNESTPYLKRKFFVAIEKIAGKCSDIIFFRNKEDFETAKKEGIGKRALRVYTGDGIDIERFNKNKFPEGFVENNKRELEIAPGKIVVGIVARLVREKGYLELFKAFKEVVEKFPNAVLIIVGGTDFDKKDKIDPSIIKDFGIQNNVLYLGERTDVDELYAIMDIFVLPSWREGFSHSIMEATAMSLPVIASDIRGCRGAVDNKETGLLISPKNYQELSRALCYLISNPKVLKEMGGKARQKAEKEFDERIFFNKIDEEFLRLSQKKI